VDLDKHGSREQTLVLSHVFGERSQKSADLLVKRTAQRLKAVPLFVTDGLTFYKVALFLNEYHAACCGLDGQETYLRKAAYSVYK
jgi:hypothetical protein